MCKKIIVFMLSLFLIGSLFSHAHAQMMGGTGYPMMRGLSGIPTVTSTQQDLQDIQAGKDLFARFKNSQISCTNLKNGDLEKIGEYLMNQSFGGNTNAHLQMNNAMKQMMGEQGEEQMHIRLAENATGCNTSTNGQGGGYRMMGWGNYGFGYGNMMNGGFGWGFGIVHTLIALIVIIDLILLGVFLWKQIKKK